MTRLAFSQSNDIASGPAFSKQSDAECAFDLVHLSRQTLGDRLLETELLGLFDKQAAYAWDRLTGAASSNAPGLADIAHMLKGSARAVGAFGVANAAERFETSIRAGGSDGSALGALIFEIDIARKTAAGLLGN